MTQKVIIYPREDDTISILWPSDQYPVVEVAKKDVPAGVPYFIIDEMDLPAEPAFRKAWVVDFSHPDGYGQGYSDVINKMVAERMGPVPPRPNLKPEDNPWLKI